MSDQFIQEHLQETNRLRALHGCGPLKLNPDISKFAQEWAKHLVDTNTMQHRPKNDYGENIFMAQGMKVSGQFAAKSWYDEIKDYSFAKNTFSGSTGHFTQLVWKETQEVGVGIIEKGPLTMVVANYKPPGNFLGQFKENVPQLTRK